MAAHCAALRVSLYGRTDAGTVYFDLLSGLLCDRSTGHAFLGVVYEQHGGSRYDLPRTGVGSVSGAASGFGTVISASISYSDTGADQFQYGRPPTSTSIWPGANTVAECGAGIRGINSRGGSRSTKLVQTTGSAIDSNIAARLPKPQFTATITVRKQGAVSAAPDWRKQCLLQESKVIENWSSQKN